jgi:hypothetical protein
VRERWIGRWRIDFVRGGVRLRWLLLIQPCVRVKAESGYMKVQSVTAAVVSAQPTHDIIR